MFTQRKPAATAKPQLNEGALLRGGMNRLKLRHLRFLVALDTHRKLQRAADEIAISQPAASKMLGEIEQAVGIALFERLPRGIEPTEYGEVLVRRARAMLAEFARASGEISAIQSGAGGSVAIGTVMAPAVGAVHEALNEIRRSRPALQISVVVAMSDVLVNDLLQSRLDFVLARIPPGIDGDDLAYRECEAEDCCLLVRRGHPLAALNVVTPADLVGRDWVLQPTGSLLRRKLDAMMHRHGLPLPDRILDTSSELITLAMVSRTDAIAAVAVAVAELLQSLGGDFEILRLSEPLTVEPFGLVRLRSRALSPAAELVYEAIERRYFGGAA